MKSADIRVGHIYLLHGNPVRVTAVGKPPTVSFNQPRMMVRVETLTGEPVGWVGAKAIQA